MRVCTAVRACSCATARMPPDVAPHWLVRVVSLLGSGKTALVLSLCRHLRDKVNMGPPPLTSPRARCCARQQGHASSDGQLRLCEAEAEVHPQPDATHAPTPRRPALWCTLRPPLPPWIAGVVTNDIFTREDCEFLVRNKALEVCR